MGSITITNVKDFNKYFPNNEKLKESLKHSPNSLLNLFFPKGIKGLVRMLQMGKWWVMITLIMR
jgi:hypothetical protein